jgi:arsenate reductase-like glutaredoxin family protein
MSKGEFRNVKNAVGGVDALVDKKSPEYEQQHLEYLVNDDIEERLLNNTGLFLTPIVRNGRKATVGYQPDVWREWQCQNNLS